MLRTFRFIVLLSLIIQQLAIPAHIARAADPDPNAADVIAALKIVATRLDDLGEFEELGEAIPLTELSPSAEDALRLGTLFTESLWTRLNSLAPSISLEDLAWQIDTIDGTYNGVLVTISGPDPATNADPVIVNRTGDLIDVQFEVEASRSDPLPLMFDAEAVNLNDGSLSPNLALATVLQFQLDTTALPSLGQAFYLTAAPTVSVSAGATNVSFGPITALLGFAEASTTGNVTLNLQIDVPFEDPDGLAPFTLHELSSSALEDLLTNMAIVDDAGTDAVSATFDFDTTLIPGTTDGTITFVDPDLSTSGDETLDLTGLGDLDDLRNFTAADALGALGRLVSWLNGLQSTGRLDVELPLLGGSFSDALIIADKLGTATAALKEGEAQTPTFDDAVEMGQDLAIALGLPAGVEIIPTYNFNVTPKTLTYQLTFGDSASASVPLDFRGDLDVLSHINITTGGTANLDAAYDLGFTFGLDLTAQPTEDGAGIGSCEDGLDNGLDSGAGGDGIDAADPDCASLQTLEQRVFLDVGTTAGSPELVARLGLAASGVDALANVGILEAGINDANLSIGSNQGEDGAGAGTCADGIDNGDADGADAADADCNFVTIDFTDSADGRLTVEDLFNVIGISPPAGASVAFDLSAKVDGTIPVVAELSGTPLGGGDITVSGTYDGPLADSLELVNNITIDGSDLATSELFNFSPCSNNEDDDGDGVVNDGCPQPGAPAAVNDPETESLALMDKILILLQLLADQLDAMEGQDIGSSLSDPLPLVGSSFKDLFSYADGLQDLVDDLVQQVQPTAEEPAQCGNGVDDDHDGVIDDGCPIVNDVPETGAQCFNDTDDEDNDPETNGVQKDGVVNDGCPRTAPTLQALESLVEARMEHVLESIPGADADDTSATLDISYDDAADDVIFELYAQVGLMTGSTFNLDLSGLGGDLVGVDLVALETTGDLGVQVNANMDLDFGLSLNDFSPFMLGSSAFNIAGQADADDLFFEASIGPLMASVGIQTPQAETACNDQVDDDFDGKINDGCAPQGAPETGDQCTGDNDGVDDDGDGIPDDGCGGEGDPATDTNPETGDQCSDDLDNDGDGYYNDGCFFPDGFADRGRVHLGASFGVEVDGADADKIALDTLSFSGTFDGVAQGSKCPTGADHACAVLPIYFEGAPLGTEPGHQLTLEITDITDPFGAGNFSMTYPDLSDLESLIASQLLDMLLLESGLTRFLEVLASVLNGEIFGFDFPLIGDQLDEAANFIPTIEDVFVASVENGGDPFSGLGLTPTAEDVQTALAPFVSTISDEVNDTGTLDEFELTFTLFCDGEEGCGIGPETGDQCNDNEDSDGDGKVNDGCFVVQDVAESGAQCENNTDDEDNDPDTAGIQSDGVVNDGCYPGGYTPPATDVDEVHFYARMGQSATASVDTGFDIGIPGLGLSSEGDVAVTPFWSIELGFGVNKDQGFFLVTQEAVGPPETGDQCTGANDGVDNDGDGVADDGCPELIVGGDATLPDTLTAQLGFLLVNVVDGDPAQSCSDPGVSSSSETPCRPAGDEPDPKSSFGAAFTINLQDPAPAASDDGRFSFAEMAKAPKFKDVIAYDLEANADVNLHIETSIEGDAALPKLIGDLKLDWRWSLQGESDADALDDDSGPNSILNNPCDTDGERNCFGIVMEDVVLDAGTFLSKLVKPVVEDAQEYTKPLQPAIDVLEAPIPVLTDLSGETVSLLTLCEELCPPEYAQLDMLIAIIKLVSFFNGIDATPGSGDLTIPILNEPLVLNGPRLQSGLLPASESRSAFLTNIDGLGSLVDSLGAKAKPGGKLSTGEVQDTSGLKSIGLTFPFLEQPSQLLMMLFGQDADLVLWEPPGLQASFSYSQKFGPIWAVPPVFLEIGGSISIKGRLGIGYDTQGLREVLFEGAGAASLLNGLFLTDRNAQGEDVPELELRGELFANAQVSVVIFSAGAGGSVYLTIAIDLEDPNQNGKLKFDEVKEIIETTGNPFCLFNLSGEFGVRIFVFAEVDLFLWSERWEKTLADIVLLSFSVQCTFDKVPVLASEQSPGVLLLHMGPNSDLRGAGSAGINATSEEFTVTQEGDGSLTVTAFGYSENKPAPAGGWTKVVADAGDAVADPKDDEDVISLVDGAVGAETVCANGDTVDDDGDGFINDGCPALDEIEEGPQCAEGDVADDDNDGLINDGCPTVGDPVPFTVPAELKGGPGDDEITGGLGNDKIDGGDGDDTLVGRGGNDQIIGGKGSDGISAGPGADKIYGDTSATTWISWDSCQSNAPETGGDGDDDIEAGLGGDKVCGQGGADTLIGGISTTPAVGPAETGGQCGNDVDDDGDGVIDDGCQDTADEMHGGSGGDEIEGGDGGDTLYGNGGEDNISGSNGNDTIDGGNETSPEGDLLIGGPGSDSITGGDGDDTIIGGNALAGEPDQGDAQLDGEGGDDTILGDNATFDENGYVLVDADIGGPDKMNGGSGIDEMRGQKGDDDMFGGDGNDDMDGNDGQDFMFGDDGAINNRATADVTVTQDGSDGVDDMHGSEGDDHMYGGGAGDFMYGDAGTDFMQGNDGGDTMRGGQQNDEMYGNDGSDIMHGDSGDDRMFGGSYASGADTGDEMYGNAGFDVMVGDNGMITGASPEVIQTSDPGNGGDDEMYGDGNDDIILGGAGGDDIWGLRGADIIVGDNGHVNRDGSAVQRIVTDDPCQGGADEIWGDEEPDIILGGNDNDVIEGNEADDIILGDNGTVVLAPDPVDGTDIFTSEPDCGGSDTISGNQGNDILLGGSGVGDLVDGDIGDTITGDDGEDIIVGDNGQVTRAESYAVERIETTYTDKGGDDTLHGNQLADVILGGHASDTIYGDDAGDTILGDNGTVVLAPDPADGTDIFTTAPNHGGSDTIAGNAGNDIILGGSGGTDLGEGNTGDTVTGDNGEDIILGDNGLVTRTEAYEVLRIASTETGLGADDILHGNADKDILLGGMAADDITGDDADDTILGDNGVVVRADGSPEANDVFSTAPNDGGSDTIAGNQGNDIILGGSGGSDSVGTGFGDTINGNAGEDIILGDNGYLTRNASDVVEDGRTTDPTLGGQDTIHGDEQDDVILGGQEGDDLFGDDGADYILGDNGTFDNQANDADLNTLDVIRSTDPNDGGDDIIRGGDGMDIAFGGTASDDIEGNQQHDILLGDHGLWDSSLPANQRFLAIFTGTTDGGDWDLIHGNEGDDFILGQQGDDELYGDADQDDMTGGHNVAGGADGDDDMYGDLSGDPDREGDGTADGAGGDVMLGDNGKITRTLLDSNDPVSWQENSFNGTYARVVELFDVEHVTDNPDVSTDLFGNDDMWGNHNDDIMYGQNGEDNMHGGAGDDYMEGNADSDYMEGDGEDDDMLGGSALKNTDDPTSHCTGCTDESTLKRVVPLSTDEGDTAEVPLGDRMFGDDGSDVMLGDNGVISRTLEGGQWIILEYNLFNDTGGYEEEPPRHTASDTLATRVDREVQNVDLNPGRTAGSDYMEGGSGDDDMYGQFDDTDGLVQPAIGDELLGNGGEDAMLGDNGVVDNWVVDTLTQIIEPNEPFIDDDIFVTGTLYRQVVLEQIDSGGNDRMKGGDNGDWMHGGAGNDLMNGNSGNDRLFGDDGEDAAWGGPHHDHLWGGYGNDYLDVKPRPEMTVTQGNDEIVVPPDPAEWFAYATDDNYQDVDYIYGGWDQDAMQADVADNGPVVGDRLIDWVGAYNVYYLCPALYGEYVNTRDLSPAIVRFLQQLAEGDGALDPSTGGTSGFNEVAIVFPKEARSNSNPIHPDTPGHFTCVP